MVNKISEETRRAINRKSAYALPDAPTEMGMGADEIRRALWKPIADETHSALCELDRVVDEMNAEFDAREAALIGTIPHLEELNREADENVARLQAYREMIPVLEGFVESARENVEEARQFADRAKNMLSGKLDKVSEPSVYYRRAYCVDAEGNQMIVIVSSNRGKGWIAIYSTGGCLRANAPVADKDIANKAFVDEVMSAPRRYVW